MIKPAQTSYVENFVENLLKSVKCFPFAVGTPGLVYSKLSQQKNKSAAQPMKVYHHAPMKREIHG